MAAERYENAAWKAIQNGPWQTLLPGNGAANIALHHEFGYAVYTESLKLRGCCHQQRHFKKSGQIYLLLTNSRLST